MDEQGKGWVIVQLVLFLLIALAPGAAEPWPLSWLFSVLGLVLLLDGIVVMLLSLVTLGPNLTPFPRPRPEGQLVTTGIYSLIRHPLYTGVVLASLGLSLFTNSLLRLLLTVALFLVHDLKASREEQWLEERFPEYPNYRQRVKKFFPGVY
ncbi:methyltransferase family protein [Anthocerotibacter panamensis]|uniref:methyltransferase family protein n=1 Tax=Anthocerotibacter panamensis TaxID=2857077 RepID=UPI001C405819|nr:isoprenylcysteine carboxylmethyltransferase family protein [Anthocerotibacter panamensis]